jgi:hypothetical protein
MALPFRSRIGGSSFANDAHRHEIVLAISMLD